MRRFGGTGTAVVLGAIGTAILAAGWQSQRQVVASCASDALGGCLGLGFLFLLGWPLLVTGLVWLGFRAGKADEPWLPTSLGLIATYGGGLLHQATEVRVVPPPVWLAAVLGAVGFGVGGMIGTARIAPLGRAALALLLLVPFVVFSPLERATNRADLTERLTRVDLPLLVPRVEGYRVTSAFVHVPDRKLTVLLRREPGMRYGQGEIRIETILVPPGFTPPQGCGPTGSEMVLDGTGTEVPPGPPCTSVGPEHWVRAESDDDQVHLLRRGAALVRVSPGIDATAADVEAAVATLAEVTPRRLAELGVE